MERELKKVRGDEGRGVRGGKLSIRGKGSAEVEFSEARLDESARRLEQYLGVAKGEINRLDYIVTQFLHAIRPTQPQLKPASLNEVVEKTVELLRPELENRGLNVKTKLQ